MEEHTSIGDCVSFTDLEKLPWLFEGKGDPQFQVYRDMKKATRCTCVCVLRSILRPPHPLPTAGLNGSSSTLPPTHSGSPSSQTNSHRELWS